jgi:hypothetical protein
MGLDWRWLSLSAYLEALEAHNEANAGDDKGPAEASEGLKRFMKAHGVGDGGNRRHGGSVASPRSSGAPGA